MKSIYVEIGITFSNIQETTAACISQWTINHSEVYLELNKLLKQKPHVYFQVILENYSNNTSIYTDVSKCDDKIACRAMSQNITKRFNKTPPKKIYFLSRRLTQ